MSKHAISLEVPEMLCARRIGDSDRKRLAEATEGRLYEDEHRRLF